MNTNTNTTNINAARNAAIRRERAEQIIKEGYTFTDMGEGGIAVCKPGKLAASYWINGPFAKGCDCPDAEKNNCKHEIAWDILQDEEKMWDACCAAYEARIELDDVPYGA